MPSTARCGARIGVVVAQAVSLLSRESSRLFRLMCKGTLLTVRKNRWQVIS
jgi:hypothetical protein